MKTVPFCQDKDTKKTRRDISGGLFCGYNSGYYTGGIGNRGFLPTGSSLRLGLDNRSWMTGDCQVQFSESAGVRFPHATRLIDVAFSKTMII
jgi:hypothetical protein